MYRTDLNTYSIVTFISLSFHVQVMSGSHSEVQHTRTTVVSPWRTLDKVMMPCSAELTSLLVAHVHIVGMDLPQGTGFFPMILKFSVLMSRRISTDPEVI